MFYNSNKSSIKWQSYILEAPRISDILKVHIYKLFDIGKEKYLTNSSVNTKPELVK